MTTFRKTIYCLTVLILITCLRPVTCLSQSFVEWPPPGPILGSVTPAGPLSESLVFGPQVRRMFNSFTSYQFGDPDPSLPNPDSRLEFPLDQWWGGFLLTYPIPLFSFHCEFLTNLTSQSNPKMQDSDWLQQGEPLFIWFPLLWVEDWGSGDQKNIFSKSRCRLNRSYTLDTSVEARFAALSFGDQRVECVPVIGFRYQHLDFTAYDGTQSYFPSSQEVILLGIPTGIFVDLPSVDLPGDSIRFNQRYYQVYIGGKASVNLNTPNEALGGGLLRLSAQADLAIVVGNNEDRHLLRGDRLTMEDTRGPGWHLAFNASYFLADNLNIGAEFDFKRLNTKGSHFWDEDQSGVPTEIWNRGVRVWSDQAFMAASAEWLF